MTLLRGEMAVDTCSLLGPVSRGGATPVLLRDYCAMMPSSQLLSHCLFIVHRALRLSLSLSLSVSVRFSMLNAKCTNRRRSETKRNANQQLTVSNSERKQHLCPIFHRTLSEVGKLYCIIPLHDAECGGQLRL